MTGLRRLLCWNVYNRRRSQEAALDFCLASGAEIVCLQEADPTLADLFRRQAGWQVHLAADFAERGQVTHLLTATREASRGSAIALNPARRASPSPLGLLSRWVECIEALQVETATGLTLANLHLSCAVGPGRRRDELARLLAALGRRQQQLVCGDFNSFAEGALKLAGPLCGFSWRDYRGRERQDLAATLAAAGLTPLAKQAATFARFGLELDHVAVSADLLPGAGIEVLPDRQGSDHHPLLVTLAAPHSSPL